MHTPTMLSTGTCVPLPGLDGDHTIVFASSFVGWVSVDICIPLDPKYAPSSCARNQGHATCFVTSRSWSLVALGGHFFDMRVGTVHTLTPRPTLTDTKDAG